MSDAKNPVGAQGPGGVDLAAVAKDDQLLDQLAARAAAPSDLSGDPVAALLAAFAEEIDDGLAELLAERELAAPAEPTGVRRGRGLRVTSMALVVGATLSVSGVAAAVTGDPLAPYKGLVSAVAGEDQLPEQAARVAALNRALRGVRAEIAHGDLAAAREHLDALTARLAAMTDLSRGERTALQARIDALEAALARAEAKSQTGNPADAAKPTSAPTPDRARPTDAGKPDNPGTSGRGDGQGGGPNLGPGRDGTGASAEKTKPSNTPHASSSEKADDQGSGSTADESVAPDDQAADDKSGATTDQNGTDTGDPADDQGGSSGVGSSNSATGQNAE